MALEPDIVERMRRDFGVESEHALALLRESGKTGRVARCIVVASRGSLELLKNCVQLAKSDHRDVIMAGEYDSAQRQVRDLRVTLLLDSPETFWLGEVACTMASRDYALASVDSRAATATPFVYTADRNEGRARFTGPEGDVELEKKDRRWSIHGDLVELDRSNMNRAFDDEREFRDALSGYLLTRRRPRV